MMTRLLFIILALSPFTAATVEGGLWDKFKSVIFGEEIPTPLTIRVLIQHDVKNAMVEVKGPYNIYDPRDNSRLGTYFSNKTYPVQALSTGIKWGEAFPGVYQLHIVPDEPFTTIVVNGVEYTGSLFIYDIGGAISIINETDIEDYLQSTMAGKFSPELHEETLAATAIAARTQAYYLSKVQANSYWDANGSETGFQGYIPPAKDAVGRAIASTKYMVLSNTGAYEKLITPFPVKIMAEGAGARGGNKFSIQEAEKLAERGSTAAKILAKSFPDAKIELAYSPEGPQKLIPEITPPKNTK